MEDSKNKTTMAPSNIVTEAAMLDELFGPMSLGESAERRGGNNEDTEENEAPTKLCSACGKESDALKMCNGCKCVWYCDVKCRDRHRKEHKKECKLIKKELDQRGGKRDLGTEVDVGPLGKLPPRDECPICMHLLPIYANLTEYNTCCGKIICAGCGFQHQTKSEEVNVKRAQKEPPLPPLPRTCPFCRTPVSRSDEETLVRLCKRVELKDRYAMRILATWYGHGKFGPPVDYAKCIDLMRRSADLGCPDAQYQLGSYHDDGKMGLEQNKEEALKYFKKAAEGGNITVRHNLGCMEEVNGDYVAAMRHWRLAASGGFKPSVGGLFACFEKGLLRHGDLAETLQAMYRARAEMKSADRDAYIEYLKRTGEYKKEYDC